MLEECGPWLTRVPCTPGSTADKQMILGLCCPISPVEVGGSTSFYLTQSLRFSAVVAGIVSAELEPLPQLTERVLDTRHLANSLTYLLTNLEITQVNRHNHDTCYEEALDIKLIKSGLKSTHEYQMQTGLTGNLSETSR